MLLDQTVFQRHHLGVMNQETPDSLIAYDEIVQEALRAVVGRVLGEIVNQGSELPGNHHFTLHLKQAQLEWTYLHICENGFLMK